MRCCQCGVRRREATTRAKIGVNIRELCRDVGSFGDGDRARDRGICSEQTSV